MTKDNISILISIVLGTLSLFLGLLSLWFAYSFSSKRYKNRYLKELIKFAKLEKRYSKSKDFFKDFFKDYGKLRFAKEIGLYNSYVMPNVTIPNDVLKLSRFKLFFKLRFEFDKDYIINWEKTKIVPLRKVNENILVGPKKDKTLIWSYSKIDPLENILVTKQSFNLIKSLFDEKKNLIKISRKISKKQI